MEFGRDESGTIDAEAPALPTSSKGNTAGKGSAKKLTPAQKKKAAKVQAQREVLKATGQFNPLTNPNLTNFNSSEPLKLSDIPLYLRSGYLYKTFQSVTDSDGEEAEETDNEIPGVPLDCRKIDTAIRNSQDLERLIVTLRYWLVTDIPQELIRYCLTNEDEWIGFTLSAYAPDFPYVADLCAIWGDVHQETTDPDTNEVKPGTTKTFGRKKRGVIAAERGQLEILKFLKVTSKPLSDARFHAAFAKKSTAEVEDQRFQQLLREHGCCFDKDTAMAAVRGGHVHCLQYLRENGCSMPSTSKMMDAACAGGHLNCVEYLYALDPQWIDGDRLLQLAAEGGHVHVMQFALDHGCEWWDGATQVLAAGGHLEGLKHAHEHGWTWHAGTCEAAAANGHLCCLQYAHERGAPLPEVAVLAAGHLDCLQYVVQHGCPCDAATCAVAAYRGRLDCLQFLHESGCPWDVSASKHGALAGQLECLKYLHTNGCEWDTSVTRAAASRSHLRCLQYLHENGCAWDSNVCTEAAHHRDINCLKYAHENGSQWDSNACTEAAYRRCLDCLKYAHENGCSWDENTYRWAEEGGYVQCLKYVHEQGCPRAVIDMATIRWEDCRAFLASVQQG